MRFGYLLKQNGNMPVEQAPKRLTHLEIIHGTLGAMAGMAKMPMDSHTLWEFFRPIDLGCMTCMGMSANGVVTGT